MAIMDAKDTLCKVTLLSIRSEDMLADHTADEFATGFKKRPAFQLRGIKQNRGSSCEGEWITKRQPSSSCPSPVAMVFTGSKDMLCRVAILNMGWEDSLAPLTIKESATGFKKSLAFRPHGIKQSRGSSGEGVCTTKRQPGSSCTSPDVMVFMGSKDMLRKVAMLNICVEMVWRTMLAHFTVMAAIKKTPAFQLRGIKQSRGSSGICGWLHEDVGFPAVRHQAEQRLVRPSI
ncbi:PDPK2 [Symbiodinium sp. CCMP2592]|nr:PDPK2 [Symbiodinium sp. CCMP2592]